MTAALEGGEWSAARPRPHFTRGKDPVPILQVAGWAPGPFWTGGKSRRHRDSMPDRPARSQSLYRRSYPANSNELQSWNVLVFVFCAKCYCIRYHKGRFGRNPVQLRRGGFQDKCNFVNKSGFWQMAGVQLTCFEFLWLRKL